MCSLGHQLAFFLQPGWECVSSLSSWFHLYLRKDKTLLSGNVSPRSQASLLSSWWTGMEGMHLLAGISAGHKWKSRSYPPLLCFGEKCGQWGMLCREGGEEQAEPPQLPLVNRFQRWRLAQRVWKPGQASWRRQIVRWVRGGGPSLGMESRLLGCVLPMKSISSPCALQNWS